MTLWDYAVAVHARAGVDEACLELQDRHGQCVSLLLWRLWALSEARAAGPETLGAAASCARVWDEAAVAPLRAARRALKAPRAPIADAARLGLRSDVAKVELAAERVLLETLEALTPIHGGGGEAPLAALIAVAARWGNPAPDEALERLIAGAL